MRPPEGKDLVRLRSSMRGAVGITSFLAFFVFFVFLVVAASCGRKATSREQTPQSPAPEIAPVERGPRVVFLGDSLTAGFGLPQSEAFPARLAALMRDEGLPIQVLNAGVSGDTSAGGLRRIDWVLRGKPDIVVIELGANDGLRGLAPEQTAANLRAIIARARAAGARVLLVGMKLPPNYGVEYTSRFEAIYPALALETGVALVPFLLEGVAGDAKLNLNDGIHPTAEGQLRVARTVLPWLAPLVRVPRP